MSFSSLVTAPIVFGTSCLGNLYEALSDDVKLEICREWFRQAPPPVVLDTAGKYGAGLALEQLGRCLRALEIPPEQVVISNKLGWKRMPLTGTEPTFEPGVWVDVQHDAQQCISYEGMLDCWREGVELLGEQYAPKLVSVHDPDEYLAGASSPAAREERFAEIIDAYRALQWLKHDGVVAAIGVGAKDWRVIREIQQAVPLDWVMLANSLTILRHPPELVEFVDQLHRQGIGVLNSAVFHAGFLAGGQYFDYRRLEADTEEGRRLFAWRDALHALCRRYGVSPAAACVQFALSPPGVAAVALNTSRPQRVAENVAAVEATMPTGFWDEAKRLGLVSREYRHVGGAEAG
jgi:D-threo-aldose 1-dehydrogenase